MGQRGILAACVLLLASCTGDDDGVADFVDTPADDFDRVALDSPIATLDASFESPPFEPAEGDPVVVTVVLTNSSDEPVRLEPCPAYRIVVGESSQTFEPGPLLLNCEAVPEIDARASARFEIVVPVPDGQARDAAPGNYVLWHLLPVGVPVSTQEVIVEREPGLETPASPGKRSATLTPREPTAGESPTTHVRSRDLPSYRAMTDIEGVEGLGDRSTVGGHAVPQNGSTRPTSRK